MRFSASSILRISLRSRSRVRSSRLNSSSCVARSFGSGKVGRLVLHVRDGAIDFFHEVLLPAHAGSAGSARAAPCSCTARHAWRCTAVRCAGRRAGRRPSRLRRLARHGSGVLRTPVAMTSRCGAALGYRDGAFRQRTWQRAWQRTSWRGACSAAVLGTDFAGRAGSRLAWRPQVFFATSLGRRPAFFGLAWRSSASASWPPSGLPE